MEALKRSLMAQGSAPPSPSHKGKYRGDPTPKVKPYVPPTTSSPFAAAAEGSRSALSTVQHTNHGGQAGTSSGPSFASAGPASSSTSQGLATSSAAFDLAPTATTLHGTALGDIEQQIQAMPDFTGNLADQQARDKAIEDLIAQSVAVDDAFDELKDARVDGMKIKLMPHQIQGYRWMRKREAGKFKGGILADDMGLGKTIQALALIVGNHPDKDAATICHVKEEESKKETTTKGKAKQSVQKDLEEDEQDEHGPGEPVDLRSKVTLIVAPVAVMNQWKREAEEKSDSLRVFIHHGTGKAANTATFKKYDVVITSYSTASSEWTSAQEGSQRTPLMKMRWLRVILDEAHNIKNHKTKQAQACFAMGDRAHSRWCLTGTPLQNNAYEMYSLIHFLAIPPFDDHSVFKEKIGEPLQSSNQNRVNWGMKRLCLVLSSILLRRTKDAQLNGKPLLNLPARNVTIMSEEFDNEEEKVFYKEWESKAQRNANREGSHIGKLVLLLRLRQATSHPFLVRKGVQSDIEILTPETSKKPEAITFDDDSPDELADMFANIGIAKTKCPRCQGTLSEGETLHTSGICVECHELEQKQGVNWSGRGSTKLRILIKLLGQIEDAGQGEKTIVFSQFTSFLDLAQRALDQEGYKYVRYDGSMNNVAREAALEKIRTSSTTRVILISLGAGSTGLNLVCCSRVILMDQHWNPQIESQGFDRAHRMGQTRDVYIYKITIRDTVEDRILALQEKKKALSSAALEGSKLKKGGNKLSKKELQYLFNGGQM